MKDDHKEQGRWSDETWRVKDSNPCAAVAMACFVICLLIACYCAANRIDGVQETPQYDCNPDRLTYVAAEIMRGGR